MKATRLLTSKGILVLLSAALLLASMSVAMMAATGEPIVMLDLREGIAVDLTTNESIHLEKLMQILKEVPGQDIQKVPELNFGGGRVAISALSHDSPWRAVLMLVGCSCFTIEVETQGVQGHWLDLANARDCDGYGGGSGASNYCAELHMADRQLGIYGNAVNLGPGFNNCPLGGRYVKANNFVGLSDTVTMQVHNGYVRIESSNGNKITLPEGGGRPCVFACGGSADQIYWLGINRVVKTHDGPAVRNGSGVITMIIYANPNYKGCCGCF